MEVPGLSVALVVPCSILTGFKTFQAPSGSFWNEPHGALLFSAEACGEAKSVTDEKATSASLLIISARPLYGYMLRSTQVNRKPKLGVSTLGLLSSRF
jgi:hypothetical protein